MKYSEETCFRAVFTPSLIPVPSLKTTVHPKGLRDLSGVVDALIVNNDLLANKLARDDFVYPLQDSW